MQMNVSQDEKVFTGSRRVLMSPEKQSLEPARWPSGCSTGFLRTGLLCCDCCRRLRHRGPMKSYLTDGADQQLVNAVVENC